MPEISDVLKRHNDAVDSLLAKYDEQLGAILAKAQARTLAFYVKRLATDEQDRVLSTPANRTLLRGLDKKFLDTLKSLGSDELTDAFVQQFGGQFVFFEQAIEATLGPDAAAQVAKANFSAPALKYLSMTAADGASRIGDVVAQVASVAKQKALLSMGGAKLGDLTDLLSDALGKTKAQALTAAATSVSNFYRTINDLGFRIIERDQAKPVRFKYAGPPSTDPVIRPFCKRLEQQTEAGNSWTREEISRMSNGQLPNVMQTCGGFNCRHSWLLTVESLKATS